MQRLDAGDRRRSAIETLQMSRDGRPLIFFQSLQIERSFILKRVVEALPPNPHCREQLVG